MMIKERLKEYFRQLNLVFSTTILVLAVGLSGANQALAQSAANADSKDQISLNLQDVDIRVLINTVAEVSGKNFIVDPRVKGKVSVISGASLSPEELYDVFLSILEVHNFATVDSGSVIKVLPSNVIKQRPTPTLFTPTQESNDEQITQIVQLKHAPVSDLVPIIRPLIPPTSHFAPHVPSNSIVLTDTAANIQRVLRIIQRIDIPDERTNVRVVYLDNAKASELSNTLTQIISSGAAAGDPKAAATAKRVSIQPLDAINALVVSAPDGDFAKIQALVDELDIERTLEPDVNVIYLKHAKAEDLVSILNDITQSSVEGSPVSFSVQADEATNSLIVKASGNQLKTVQGVIEQLDVRRAQVFVETVIAEVSLDQAADLGVQWNIGGPRTTSTTTNADGTSTSTTTGNLVDTDTGQVIGTAGAGTAFNLGTGGLTYSLLDFKKYQLDVIVNALRSDTNSNILSTPTILTLDNEEAEIVVGQEVPFVTGRFNNGNNSSQSQDSDGNVTVVNSGNQFQTIERKDVGIKLKIKPQISDGDVIQLEVSQEISSVSNITVQGQADLITNRRSIDAVVQVDDGQVIALGGLIQDDVIDTVEWVPILGKIPVIGNLFKSKSKTAIKRNLMVFLKPRIIRSAEELEEVSRGKYDEVRRDGRVSQKTSSRFLINDSAPPVLDEYDEVKDAGVLGTEEAREDRKKPLPEPTEDDIFKYLRSPDGDAAVLDDGDDGDMIDVPWDISEFPESSTGSN
jgi:general secretion pathway protein D